MRLHRFPGLRALAPAVLLLGALAGCGGGSGSGSGSNNTAFKTYTDKTFGFSFQHPSDWQIPNNKGKTETIGNVPTYVVTVKAPDGQAQLQVTVDGQIIQFPPFEDGKVSPDPSGGPDTFHYLHAKVSGLPAMHVERWNGKNMDEVDTFVNTRTKAYDIRMDTGTPPFSRNVLSAYNRVVRSMKIGLT